MRRLSRDPELETETIKQIAIHETYQKFWKDKGVNIDWVGMRQWLDQNIPVFANEFEQLMKISKAHAKKQWEIWGKYSLDRYDRYFIHLSHNDRWFMNNVLFDIFNKCNEPGTLKRAAEWSRKTITMYEPGKEDPNVTDTYANLLYKAGEKQRAIAIETHALNLAADPDVKKDISSNLTKMQAGLPTWKNE